MRVGIIGLGAISPIHIKAAGEHLVAVCDINPAQKKQAPGAAFYTDYKAMIQAEKLDCVHICLPHYLHYECALFSIEHGVPVFLEKPICLSIKEGAQLQKIAEDLKIPVCVCYQNRYNLTTETLLKEISSGKYGCFLGVKGLVTWCRTQGYFEVAPWRASMAQAGGGVLNNQSIHTLDLLSIIGGELDSIAGYTANFLEFPLEVEDTSFACLRFKNGGTGIFFATIANATNSSVEIEVVFETAVFEIKHGQLFRQINETNREILADDLLSEEQYFYYGNSHMKLIHLFYECIRNKTSVPVSLSDSLISLKMIELIRESSSTGRPILF